MGSDQFFRGNRHRLGGAQKVGFVIGEEFERCGQNRRIAKTGAQSVRIEPGQGQEPLRAIIVFQHPAKCTQGKRAS